MRGFLNSLRQYAVFDGRSSRSEYWSFMVYAGALTVLLAAADTALGLMSYVIGLGLYSGLFTLAITLPLLAVTSRRMHDAGWPGWLAALHLIPAVGTVVVSLAALKATQPHRNPWGDPPVAARGGWRVWFVNGLLLTVLLVGGTVAFAAFVASRTTTALASDGHHYQESGRSFGTRQPATACLDEVLNPSVEYLPLLKPDEDFAQVALSGQWLKACLAASAGRTESTRLCGDVPFNQEPLAVVGWINQRCQQNGAGVRCNALLQEVIDFCGRPAST